MSGRSAASSSTAAPASATAAAAAPACYWSEQRAPAGVRWAWPVDQPVTATAVGDVSRRRNYASSSFAAAPSALPETHSTFLQRRPTVLPFSASALTVRQRRSFDPNVSSVYTLSVT